MRMPNWRSLTEILGSRVLIVLFAALTDILISRVMTIPDRGAFSALQGSILLLAGLCTCGLEYGFMLTPELPDLSRLMRRYLRALPMLATLTVALIVGFFLRYELDVFELLAVAVITVAEVATIMLLPLILQYRSAGRFGLVRILRRGLLFLGLFVAFPLLPQKLITLPVALGLNALAWVIAAGLAIISVKDGLGLGAAKAIPPLAGLWRKGAGVFFAKYAERAHSRVGLLVLGFFGMPEHAAYFAVGALAVELSIFIAGSLSIAVITRRGDSALLEGRSLLVVGVLIAIFNVIVGATVWLLARPAIHLIYGVAYDPVVPLVRLLMPALVVYGAYPLLSTHLLKLCRTKLVLLGNYLALAANFGYLVFSMVTGQANAAMAAVHALLLGLLLNVLIVGLGSLNGRRNG